MNARGNHLLETANGQISELIGLIAARGEATLRLPCPGREKLGDGTVAACGLHTADNYHRIAGFYEAGATAGTPASRGSFIAKAKTNTRTPTGPRTSLSRASLTGCPPGGTR